METTLERRQDRLVEVLVAARKKAGIRQVELAKALGTSQAWVARLEGGGRRVDVVEYLQLSEILGFNPRTTISELLKVK